MTGHNSIPCLAEEARKAATALAASKSDVLERGLELGRLLCDMQELWEEEAGATLNGPALGSKRRKHGVSPDDLGLTTSEMSCWQFLARHEEAFKCYLHHWASLDDDGIRAALDDPAEFSLDMSKENPPATSANPQRLKADWQRKGRRVRSLAGARKPYREKFFPGISKHIIGEFLGKSKLGDDEVIKIQGLVRQAEDRAGTPEGEAFKTKAESMAEQHGHTVDEIMAKEVKKVNQAERKREIDRAEQRLVSALSDDDVFRAILRFAATHVVDHRGIDGLDDFVNELKEKLDG